LIVTTTQGRVRGREQRGVLAFRGVPFARAQRFRAPEPAPAWDGVRDAFESGPACPQQAALPAPVSRLIGGSGGQDEDCLSLDLWTPAADARRRPVLVWIHGGAFLMGRGSTPLYSGRRMARRGDVVVVTINYRLGVLGFLDLSARSGACTANAGLLDQVAALEWVRDNAEAFGGDPDNVTIFGESAGAMSVSTLLATPRARGLFHRAIAQSGAAHHVSSRARAAEVAGVFASAFGSDDVGTLERASVEALLDAQRKTTLEVGRGATALPWQPSVDGDVLPASALEAVGKGSARDIPLLIGTNRDEWNLFALFDVRSRRMDAVGLQRRLRRALPGQDERGTPLATRALEIYGERGGTPHQQWCAFQTDRVFRYPALRLAELQREHSPNTYAYLFEWRPPLLGARIGACHGLELPFVFGTLRSPALRTWLGATRRARRVSDDMQRAWVEFARTGRRTTLRPMRPCSSGASRASARARSRTCASSGRPCSADGFGGRIGGDLLRCATGASGVLNHG